MEVIENTIEYTISRHCMERYAERIMGKDNLCDVKHFVIDNEDKIKTDINKMIEHGELIYAGRQNKKDGKNNIVDVYLKNCWIVIADNKTHNVITLYKVDLGLDDEFNKAYISKMMEKLNANKEALENIQQQVQEESNTYREMIADAEVQIKEYRTMIKHLEELCEGYKTIIDNNIVKVSQSSKEVTDTLNTLIGKKEF